MVHTILDSRHYSKIDVTKQVR